MVASKIDADKIWKVAWTYIRTVVDTLREPFLILDNKLKVLSANKMYYLLFQATKSNTEGKRVYDLGNGQWNIPELKILLEDILPKNTHFEDFKVDHIFPKIGHRVMMLNARRIYTTKDKRPILLLAMEDVTKQIELENKIREHTKDLTAEVAEKTAALQNRVQELERTNKTMVDREIKMIELKKELRDLKVLIKNNNTNHKNGSKK